MDRRHSVAPCLIVALVATVLAGCGSAGALPASAQTSAPALASSTTTPSPAATASPAAISSPVTTPKAPGPSGAVTLGDAASCPRTIGTAGPPGAAERGLFGWSSSHGNGELWVGGLWPDGIIAAGSAFVQPDGSIGMKFGWWREVPGKLTITGKRLDAPAPSARGEVPDGYGPTGFQASGVVFPTEGCWEVTGSVGSTTLTIVTFVIRTG